MDLRGFFTAIFTDWVSLMSGIASVTLTILGVVRKWDAFPRRALWVAALICFFFASTRVWTEEHRSRLTAEQHLQDLTIPILSGVINFVSVAPTANQADSIVTLVATLKNSGAPSVADDVSMRIRLKNNREIRLTMMGVQKGDIQLGSDQIGKSMVMLRPEDYLSAKAIAQPIAKGGAAQGWTWGLARGATKAQVIEPGTTIILSFTDVTGKNCEISRVMTGVGFDYVDPSLLQRVP